MVLITFEIITQKLHCASSVALNGHLPCLRREQSKKTLLPSIGLSVYHAEDHQSSGGRDIQIKNIKIIKKLIFWKNKNLLNSNEDLKWSLINSVHISGIKNICNFIEKSINSKYCEQNTKIPHNTII